MFINMMSKNIKLYSSVIKMCNEYTQILCYIYAIFIRCYHDMNTIDIYIELVKYK